jgi:hypothetical protein
MEGDLAELPDAQDRIFHALRDRFDTVDLILFDEKFEVKPKTLGEDQPPTWGGYQVSFKLIERKKFEELGGRIEDVRRQSLVIGSGQRRVFTVDLSKYEYTAPKVSTELDHYTIYVYTPEMIYAEKLRAICQQMPEYSPMRHPGSPRARDFYDIHLLTTTAGVDLSKDIDLLLHVFAAKDVPLNLLARVGDYREFHRPDWPAVVASVGQPLEEFDFYFDFVLGEVAKLEALGVE